MSNMRNIHICCSDGKYKFIFEPVQNLRSPRNITTFVLIIYGTKQPMTTETPILNDHNKAEYPPMHNEDFDVSPINI